MQKMFNDTISKIESKIVSCNHELHNELSTLRQDIHRFKHECSSEVKKLSASFSSIQADVQHNNERLSAMKKSNDLLLYGVTYTSEEDLNTIFFKISAALGYSSANTPAVYLKRLTRQPIASGVTPPIMIQFSFKLERDEFYRRYLVSRNLSLNNIGFNTSRRIFLNENLTELARHIKTEALNLKRTGQLFSVYTKDGSVYVKKSKDAAALLVQSLEHLRQ